MPDSTPTLAAADLQVFGPWLVRWRLTPDGAPVAANSSRLLPVRRDGRALMLKAAMEPREIAGSAYLDWLGGGGAAKVFAREVDAVLMERLTGGRSLPGMDNDGAAETVARIMCGVAAALHAPRPSPPPSSLYPLAGWFERLDAVASAEGGLLARAAAEARGLLADPCEACVLHGDLHQFNVLDGGARGWLAIDPSGLAGERGFEFALMVLPPNLEHDRDPAVLGRRARLYARHAGVEPDRLLRWVMCQTALWAAWAAPGRDWRAVTAAAAAALDGR